MVVQLVVTHGLNFHSLDSEGQTILHALAKGDAMQSDRAASASINDLKMLVVWLTGQDPTLKDVRDHRRQLAWVSKTAPLRAAIQELKDLEQETDLCCMLTLWLLSPCTENFALKLLPSCTL